MLERQLEMANRQREMVERQYEMAERQKEHHTNTRHKTLRKAEEARLKARKEAERKYKEAYHVREDFKEYRDFMFTRLKSDGLISQNAKKVTISYPDGKMHVDGQLVPHALEDQYCNLNKGYHIYKNEGAVITISKNRIDMTNSKFKYGDTETTSWTFSTSK